MSLINVINLTFSYDSYYDNIFDNTSFQIDTDWKLGFTGRNGRGKTTFLNLLLGKFEYKGEISSSVSFDYFPFVVKNKNKLSLEIIKDIIAPFNQMEKEMEYLINKNTTESLAKYGEVLEEFMHLGGYNIDSIIEREISKLELPIDVLLRPFDTLSSGEQTKILLAGLFLKKNNFLLIDEPTNHVDIDGRQVIVNYLKSKKGFILVSHDRYLLDNVIDHILVINKNNIEVQNGNFSSWQINKNRQDMFELTENEKLKKDIKRLETAAKRTASWSNKVESSKIGTHAYDRGFIGHKAAKMMKRSKSIEKNQNKAIESKVKLLKNIEKKDILSLNILDYNSDKFVEIIDLSIMYNNKLIFNNINFSINKGDRVAIKGKNGSGKSSILKLLVGEEVIHRGKLSIKNGINISYVPQVTSFLKGSIKDFTLSEKLDESIFKAVLRKLDFSREQFEKGMENFSEGQKKKVLLAKSILEPAHLYIWDEPLNFIDVITRMQVEELLLKSKPTIIFVEHDTTFNKNIATKTISL